MAAERELTDSRVRKIIELKKKVCTDENSSFVVINQKGIDPISLDMLAREGILGLRRAKKRNMERLAGACGGYDINSVEELTPECLGYAGKIYEYNLGEEKFTFVEDVKNPKSCTILIKGPNDHTIAQIKNAVKDGLGAVRNTIIDGYVIPGAGSFEIQAAIHLRTNLIPKTHGKSKLGIEAFAEALLGIPKVLAENSGFDPQDVIVQLLEEAGNGNVVGLDVITGEPCDPTVNGIYDNYNVKKQIIQSAPLLAQHLLLCDEIIRAGINTRKQ